MSLLKSFLAQSSSMDELQQALTTTVQGDPNLWKLDVDKAGNGAAVIRFLPYQTSGMQWAKVHRHWYKNKITNKVFNEYSAQTWGDIDLTAKFCIWLYRKGEVYKDLWKDIKASESYFANIYVVSDPAKKENEGKVKVLKFGYTILSKIKNAAMPAIASEQPRNIFHPIDGCEFKFIQKKKADYANYDDSGFRDISVPLASTNEKMEEILSTTINVTEEYASEKFRKSDQALFEMLDNVMERNSAWQEFCAESGYESKYSKNVSAVTKQPKKPVIENDDIPFDTDLPATTEAGGNADEEYEKLMRSLDM